MRATDPKPYKVSRSRLGKIEFRKIRAHQARDFDGTPSNWVAGTPDGDRELIEKRFIPRDKDLPIRYTNCW